MIIRFRVTEEEKGRIQSMADKLTNGNMSLLIKTLLNEKEKAMTKETRYDLICRTKEIKNKRDIKDGCTFLDESPEKIASFGTKEEALKALESFRSSAKQMRGTGLPFWYVTEYSVEENVYENDEWVDGGDVWAYSEWEEEE